MLGSEAVAQIKQVLGFRTNLDSTILANLIIEQGKLELAPTKPWFLLSAPATLVTVASTQTVALPADFLDEWEEGGIYYTNSDSEETELTKGSYDILKANFRDAEEGEPEAYALVGQYLAIFPTPDDAYTLNWRYYNKDDEITAVAENQWLKYIPTLLIGKAGAIVAASLRDFEAVKIFDRMTQEGMMLLQSQNEARQFNNYDMQMGGPH